MSRYSYKFDRTTRLIDQHGYFQRSVDFSRISLETLLAAFVIVEVEIMKRIPTIGNEKRA